MAKKGQYSFSRAYLEGILTLWPRDIEWLMMRFGDDRTEHPTMEEAGSSLGVKVGRAREIEAGALRRLEESRPK